MKLTRSISFVMTAAALAGSVGCKPSPTSAAAAQTEEGRPCGPEAVIEDGEDNNNQVIVQDGRNGYIYTFADHEGSTITPQSGELGGTFSQSPGGANGSGFAARMTGKVATAEIVYVGMGFNLTDPKEQYDASKYKGLAFYAKKGPNSTSKVRLKVPDVNTDPDGGICGACYNDFGKDLILTEEWQKFTIPFDDMRQMPGWGSPRPSGITPSKLYAIQFQVNDKGKDYDIWVDDLQFTGCPGK